MDQDAIRAVIVDELKALRKGVSIEFERLRLKPDSLLWTAVGRDRSALVDLMKSMTKATTNPDQAEALLNALGVSTSGQPGFIVTDALTTRRRVYATRNGLSERTVVRYEDAAIIEWSWLLAQRFTSDQPYIERIEKLYLEPESDAVKMGVEPDDLVSLITYQARMIDSIVSVLTVINSQLEGLKKSNAMMVKMLGM